MLSLYLFFYGGRYCWLLSWLSLFLANWLLILLRWQMTSPREGSKQVTPVRLYLEQWSLCYSLLCKWKGKIQFMPYKMFCFLIKTEINGEKFLWLSSFWMGLWEYDHWRYGSYLVTMKKEVMCWKMQMERWEELAFNIIFDFLNCSLYCLFPDCLLFEILNITDTAIWYLTFSGRLKILLLLFHSY